MSNRRKSEWERHAQYERNQERHIHVKEELGEDGRMKTTRTAGKQYFTAQRKMFKNMMTHRRRMAASDR